MRLVQEGRFGSALVGATLLLVVFVPMVHAQDICADPGNLTFNCQFDSFDNVPPYGAVASGWTPFVEFSVEPPAFNSSGETPVAPAQEIFSGWLPFTAGIYQQVEVTPGVGYAATIGWAAYASYGESGERNAGQFIGRKVGIDPLGGTDPTSPSIVWSPEVWDEQGGIFPQLRVSAVAQRQTITVFVRAHNPQSHGNDKVWFDAVTLTDDPTLPTATATSLPPSPTPTAPPPTATSTPLPPTATPVPSDTPLPTSTATVQPTDTATPTATPTPTHTPTATAGSADAVAPNVAPAPTATMRLPTATPAPARQSDASSGAPDILLAIAAVSFAGAGVLAGVVFLLLLRRL